MFEPNYPPMSYWDKKHAPWNETENESEESENE